MNKHSVRFLQLAAGLSLVAVAIAARSTAGSAAPLVPAPIVDNKLSSSSGEEVAVLAGGCFWGVESVFRHTKGVKVAVSGFAAGNAASLNKQVNPGSTAYVETVRIVFDPSVISYGQVLRIFFGVIHDPTQLNRQGPDVGAEYRSEIFFQSDAQRKIVEAYIAQLTKADVFAKPIVTLISPKSSFKVAPAAHQNYAEMHPDDPYIVANDAPKVERLRADFPELYK